MGIREDISKELTEHIIPFWQNMRDTDGGYYGQMDFDLNIIEKSDKGSILNSRILWFFSSAYLMLKQDELLEHAQHAYNFLQQNYLDKEHGGLYWSVAYNGDTVDDTKHTYAMAFAVYALSAYYKVSGKQEAIDMAFELFNTIEERCKDEDGYLESFSREWKPVNNEKLSENGVTATRTMNTLLHVFEAYAGLYEAKQDSQVENCMRYILQKFLEKVYNPQRRRLEVFFDLEYTSLIDLHSYGHDIEASWLLDWGAGLLKDSELSNKVSAMTDILVEEVYEKAYKKYSLYNECEKGINDKTRVWWVQAEGIVGFLNAHEKQPQKPEYLQAAQDIWNYITENVIDKRSSSEWFWEVDDNGDPSSHKNIVEAWKCPYHNGRMCLEVLRRI